MIGTWLSCRDHQIMDSSPECLICSLCSQIRLVEITTSGFVSSTTMSRYYTTFSTFDVIYYNVTLLYNVLHIWCHLLQCHVIIQRSPHLMSSTTMSRYYTTFSTFDVIYLYHIPPHNSTYTSYFSLEIIFLKFTHPRWSWGPFIYKSKRTRTSHKRPDSLCSTIIDLVYSINFNCPVENYLLLKNLITEFNYCWAGLSNNTTSVLSIRQVAEH